MNTWKGKDCVLFAPVAQPREAAMIQVAQEMRGKSQLLRSANSYVGEAGSVKTLVILLLTTDNELQDLAAQAFSEISGVSYLVPSADDALKTVGGVQDLDLAIIDFEHGLQGMGLLSAINRRRRQLPVIVITSNAEKCLAAVAYTKGAAMCLAKPVSAAHLMSAIHQLCGPKLETAVA
jgi:DNA-binding NtrC family response regulator